MAILGITMFGNTVDASSITGTKERIKEIKIVEEKKGEKPILLLDDVLSELDRNRQNYLLEHIKGIQTIITCTGLEEFVKNGINIQKTFEIESGKVKR